MSKTALIVGSDGQDGKILFDFLVRKKYQVLGISKTGMSAHNYSWKHNIDITKAADVTRLLKKIKPTEIYYLAAFHHSSEDAPIDPLVLFKKSYEINCDSVLYFLEAIKRFSPTTKFFYAASSLIFGRTLGQTKQNENTPFNPDSFYGLSKLSGLLLCRQYREKYGLFASVGIFYNHESAFREKKFISRKIIQGAIDIKNKKEKIVKIGNLQAEADWGYAPDFVEAAYKILRAAQPDEFIVATGKKHSVQDFVRIAFTEVGLDWKKHVVVDKQVITRKRIAAVGDIKKISKVTGWKPRISFETMVKKIIEQLDT